VPVVPQRAVIAGSLASARTVRQSQLRSPPLRHQSLATDVLFLSVRPSVRPSSSEEEKLRTGWLVVLSRLVASNVITTRRRVSAAAARRAVSQRAAASVSSDDAALLVSTPARTTTCNRPDRLLLRLARRAANERPCGRLS